VIRHRGVIRHGARRFALAILCGCAGLSARRGISQDRVRGVRSPGGHRLWPAVCERRARTRGLFGISRHQRRASINCILSWNSFHGRTLMREMPNSPRFRARRSQTAARRVSSRVSERRGRVLGEFRRGRKSRATAERIAKASDAAPWRMTPRCGSPCRLISVLLVDMRRYDPPVIAAMLLLRAVNGLSALTPEPGERADGSPCKIDAADSNHNRARVCD